MSTLTIGNWLSLNMNAFVIAFAVLVLFKVALLLLGFFLVPTLKSAREMTYARLVDSQREGYDTTKTALRLLRSYGRQDVTLDWCLALAESDMNRLDEASKTQVMLVQYYAAEPQRLRARLDLLKKATWWSYRWDTYKNRGWWKAIAKVAPYLALSTVCFAAAFAFLVEL